MCRSLKFKSGAENVPQRGNKVRDNQITGTIVDATIEVHRTLGGPGLLESLYEESLAYELQLRGYEVQRQVSVPVTYKGNPLAHPLKIDLLVMRRVIVECKATTKYNAVYEAQVLTYLRLLQLNVGMVINFGERLVKDGIRRVVNRL